MTLHTNIDDAAPLYSVVQQRLRRMIAEGALKPGQVLPSETALCREHGVSRITVRRALDDLAARGIVKRRQGIGTFVSDRPSKSVHLTASLDTVFAPVHDLVQELLDSTVVRAPQLVASALRIPQNARVRRLDMLFCVSAGPYSFSHTYVTTSVWRAIDPAQLMRERPAIHIADAGFGKALTRAEQTIDPDIAGREIANRLGLKPRAPLLRVSRTYFVADDTPVAVSVAWYHPKRFRYTVDLVGSLHRG